MTDQEFLEADFDALLATMSMDEINARHDQIDAGRQSAHAAAEAAFVEYAHGMQVVLCKARRRCLECGETLPPKTIQCTECGEPLPVLSAEVRRV